MPPKKKADVPCGNPLLLGWIGEWMEIARSQNSKTYHTYRKAYTSMSKYPLPFNHPREATQLEGIGPGIVNKLEKKMKEYCEKNGLPFPQEVDPKPTKRLTEGKDSGDSESTENPPKPRKRRTKPYVPQYRSGAYALLLGLLSEHGNTLTQGFMTKEALTKEAQAYCDTSFTVPLPGKHYTSWSSMKTLIDKDLVYKQGNPGRYILTEAGLTLATQLSQASRTRNPSPSCSSMNSSEDEFSCSQQTSALSESENSDQEASFSQSSITDSGLPYLYVTPSEEHVKERVKASAKMNGTDYSIQYRIVYPSSSRATAYHMQVDLECHCPTDDNLLIGYIPQAIAQKIAPGLSLSRPRIQPSSGSVSDVNYPSDSESVASQMSCASSIVAIEVAAPIYPSRVGSLQRTDSTLSDVSSVGDGDVLFPPFNPIQFLPGSFEVVMILDNREVAQKSDRGYIQKELERRGVPVLTRNLELGDVLWVARQFNCGGSEEEIFLGYVVERKRMDDLVASIKDGRFKEQKFRLNNCGASQIVYLVEGNETDGTKAFGGSTAIQTAISSTQVVDGFFLKRTESVDDSITYLTRMTKQLQTMYTTSTLLVVPDSLINKATYLALREHLATIEPGKDFYITYGSYCQLNSKSGSLSLQDLFIKMLVTARGITAEKAYEIVKKYPTPKSLFEAYDSLDSEEAKRCLLKDNARAVRRKNIGATLSERLYRVWCLTNYDGE